jgi:hypothetical protein
VCESDWVWESEIEFELVRLKFHKIGIQNYGFENRLNKPMVSSLYTFLRWPIFQQKSSRMS